MAPKRLANASYPTGVLGSLTLNRVSLIWRVPAVAAVSAVTQGRHTASGSRASDFIAKEVALREVVQGTPQCSTESAPVTDGVLRVSTSTPAKSSEEQT